ncbi:MAG: hypothetical protein ACRDPA_12625, partial [Solirubrobacteraceae bacterium]
AVHGRFHVEDLPAKVVHVPVRERVSWGEHPLGRDGVGPGGVEILDRRLTYLTFQTPDKC